jgi:hypothetical protein
LVFGASSTSSSSSSSILLLAVVSSLALGVKTPQQGQHFPMHTLSSEYLALFSRPHAFKLLKLQQQQKEDIKQEQHTFSPFFPFPAMEARRGQWHKHCGNKYAQPRNNSLASKIFPKYIVGIHPASPGMDNTL